MEGFELIYYARKVGNQLHLLQRGYNHSSPNSWSAGSNFCCPVMAEHHNALKDAIIKIQQKIGLSNNPSNDSINGILNYLENKWLSPKPIFKAYPKIGPTPLKVTFHNFSLGHGGRYLWDFGDGTTSTESNPTHIYEMEGKYTIRLTMVTESGSRGLTEKSEFVEVNNNYLESFLYVSPTQGDITTEFKIIDQSDGDIIERHWFFGDGTEQTINVLPATQEGRHPVNLFRRGPGTMLAWLIVPLLWLTLAGCSHGGGSAAPATSRTTGSASPGPATTGGDEHGG